MDFGHRGSRLNPLDRVSRPRLEASVRGCGEQDWGGVTLTSATLTSVQTLNAPWGSWALLAESEDTVHITLSVVMSWRFLSPPVLELMGSPAWLEVSLNERKAESLG